MATGSRPARASSRSRKTAGFKTAVTTRPGMTYPASADHMTALQRVSLNGHYQDERILPVLTSGSATARYGTVSVWSTRMSIDIHPTNMNFFAFGRRRFAIFDTF